MKNYNCINKTSSDTNMHKFEGTANGELGIPCHMNHNIVLSQNRLVQVAQNSNMKYKHMDLGQALEYPAAPLQQDLEGQMLDSCILEMVEHELFQHSELETVVEITGMKSNPLISESRSTYLYESDPLKNP